MQNSAKICQYMLGAKDVAQGARVCQYVSRKKKEEPIRGFISQVFIFLKRGMLGTLIIIVLNRYLLKKNILKNT